jgi:hypothetical protein
MQALDYQHNAYLAVTLSPSSTINPSTLHSSAIYKHKVGELSDTHLLEVPKDKKDEVLERLNAKEGVVKVDVVERKMRTKRGGEL